MKTLFLFQQKAKNSKNSGYLFFCLLNFFYGRQKNFFIDFNNQKCLAFGITSNVHPRFEPCDCQHFSTWRDAPTGEGEVEWLKIPKMLRGKLSLFNATIDYLPRRIINVTSLFFFLETENLSAHTSFFLIGIIFPVDLTGSNIRFFPPFIL